MTSGPDPDIPPRRKFRQVSPEHSHAEGRLGFWLVGAAVVIGICVAAYYVIMAGTGAPPP